MVEILARVIFLSQLGLNTCTKYTILNQLLTVELKHFIFGF